MAEKKADNRCFTVKAYAELGLLRITLVNVLTVTGLRRASLRAFSFSFDGFAYYFDERGRMKLWKKGKRVL